MGVRYHTAGISAFQVPRKLTFIFLCLLASLVYNSAQ